MPSSSIATGRRKQLSEGRLGAKKQIDALPLDSRSVAGSSCWRHDVLAISYCAE
jgi:hypothetical protein